LNPRQLRLTALQQQIKRLNRQLTTLTSESRRYSWIRFAIFIAGSILTEAAFNWLGSTAGWISLAIMIISFSVAVRFHRQIQNSSTRHHLWRKIKRAQIARMQLDWDHIPQLITLSPEPKHPFEADLDLVGERSLHHLMNTATSMDGSKRLHQWLSNPNPQLATIQQRQALVRELAKLPRFRDKLILYSTMSSSKNQAYWDSQHLLDWLKHGQSAPSLKPTLLILIVLSIINIVLFLLNNQGVIPPIWVFSFVPYAALTISKILRTGGLFDQAAAMGDITGKLKLVFSYLESYPYADHEHLRKLCQPFLTAEHQPSTHLQRLTRIIAGASLQRTQLLWLAVNAVIPWDIFVAHRLDQLKAELIKELPVWLDVWFELEALNSIANLAYLNPDYTFPEFVSTPTDNNVVRTEGIGHPLLEADTKVVNNFSIQALGDVVIITGSNMSGKSSFLRTMGVNFCLANAGGPVNAQVFQTRLLRLFTCIKVSDSVTDGISYFYAEVKRLKALLSALETEDARPLFFLIDEIFRGTNNRERLIGSRAYVRALAGKNGAGIVSTHDLELVSLESTIEQISNYHFEETVKDGQMIFDYQLRLGPSPTTNALKIMEMEGLPVDG
jgi:DNA mismatch repair ATPase MutS